MAEDYIKEDAIQYGSSESCASIRYRKHLRDMMGPDRGIKSLAKEFKLNDPNREKTRKLVEKYK